MKANLQRLICLVLAAPGLSLAEAVCKEENDDCVKVGVWSVSIAAGVGLRENPVAGRENIPLILLPSVSYYGKRFSLENYNLSYLLAETKHHSIDFVITPSLEYMFFNDWSLGSFSLENGSSLGSEFGDASAGTPTPESGTPTPVSDGGDGTDSVDNDGGAGEDDRTPIVDHIGAVDTETIDVDDIRDRDLVILAGLGYGFYSGPFHLGFQLLQDVGGEHNGQEVRFAASYERIINRHQIRAGAGVLWKSAKTMDYYYGLAESDVDNFTLVYEAEAGAGYFVKASWSKQLSERWSVTSAAYYRHMSDEASNSPLINKQGIATFFIGGAYRF